MSRRAPTREVESARRLLWLIPTSVIVLAIGVRLFVTSEFMRRHVAAYVAGELAHRTRSAVQLGNVTFSLAFAPCFHELEIYRYHGPLEVRLTTKRACVADWASAVGSGFRAIRLQLEDVSVEFRGTSTSRVRSIVDTASSPPKADGGTPTLREIQIVFDDLRLEWATMPFPNRFANGTFGPISGMIALQMRGGKSAATVHIEEPHTGSSIDGRVTPTEDGWDLSAGLRGDLVAIFGDLLRSAELDIRKLPTRGRLGARYIAKDRFLTLDLDLSQYDVDLANAMVSSNRVRLLTAAERARIAIDFANDRLSLEDGMVEVNGIPVLVSLRLSRGETSPAFEVGVELHTIPLALLMRSFPGAEDPEFARRVSPKLLFAFSFTMSGELGQPKTWQPVLDHRIQGVGEPGVATGFEFLDAPFEYHPLTSDGRTKDARIIGPGTASWTPYRAIPTLLRRAIVASEDGSFFLHNGIDMDEMRAAIQATIETGKNPRGGSTITQQLVKNLFLSRDRTAMRKLEELLLTLHMERSLGKDRIFEIYANIIEWGPNIHGLADASRHYFRRPPAALSPLEMVYLAKVIPAPVGFHRYFESGIVPPEHMTRLHATLRLLNRLGQLSEEDMTTALSQTVVFAR